MKILAVLALGLTSFAAQSFAATSGECIRNPNVKGFPVRVSLKATDAKTYAVQYQVADEAPQVVYGVKRFAYVSDSNPQDYSEGFESGENFRLSFITTEGMTIGWNLTVPGHKFIGNLHCQFK